MKARLRQYMILVVLLGLMPHSEKEKLKNKYKPLVFKLGDGRFDLFVKKIFRTAISPKMKEDVFAVHDFKNEHNLRVRVFRKEHIVLLKAVTERDRDFEDILTIIRKEKNFDWQYFIDEVLWQTERGDSWALFDAEKMLRELKKYVFVEEKYLKRLYQAREKMGDRQSDNANALEK